MKLEESLILKIKTFVLNSFARLEIALDGLLYYAYTRLTTLNGFSPPGAGAGNGKNVLLWFQFLMWYTSI